MSPRREKLTSPQTRIALARVRWLWGWVLVQTSQPQPMAGTPTLVPVPSKIISPRILVLASFEGKARDSG